MPTSIYMHFQGDLTVIQCPAGGTAGGKITLIDAGVLVDTGFTKAEVFTYLAGQTYKKVILTHPDADHINYVISATTTAFQVPPIYHSCNWNTYYNQIINDVKITNKALQILPPCCGTECSNYFICNRQVTLNIIASELVGCNIDTNRASIVTKIKYANTITLISGDFEDSQAFVNGFITCVHGLCQPEVRYIIVLHIMDLMEMTTEKIRLMIFNQNMPLLVVDWTLEHITILAVKLLRVTILMSATNQMELVMILVQLKLYTVQLLLKVATMSMMLFNLQSAVQEQLQCHVKMLT